MIAEPISLLNAPKCEPLPSRPDFRQRIRVVEDERKLREQTAKDLTDAGYRVDVAEDGAAAWAALQLSKYDLVITDQFMPKLTGVGLLKKMHAARMALPVIMATGFLPTWEFTLHTWLQPVKMLLKPYSFEELLALVKNVLPQTSSVVCFQESSGSPGLARGRKY
jgi:DNA-binding response OmpR family regulator